LELAGKHKMMLTADGYVVTLWALLISIVVAPGIFKYVLGKEVEEYRKQNPATKEKMAMQPSGWSM
jgi:hypothetical protein